ncbi:hypothetical protein TNCV_4507001 [Trichonephila clavipes]|nr:hypothetical protein TNCV_4507001 [Trichonephila clavipes]
MGCPLTSSSLCKASGPSFSDKAPVYFVHVTRASPSNSVLPRSPSDHGESPSRSPNVWFTLRYPWNTCPFAFQVNTRDLNHFEGWEGFDKNHEKDRGGFGKFGINIGQWCTVKWKTSDGRDYSTLIDVARFSCTKALGDVMLNGGVSIESRLFPRRAKHAVELGQACNEPSIKQIKYGFFFQCFDNQGEYSFVTQSVLDRLGDMFRSSTSFYRHLGRWSNTLVSCPEC